jgi:hypothetical protein
VSDQDTVVETPVVEPTPTPVPESNVVHPEPAPEVASPPVNAARSAAGRIGAHRVHELMRLGLEYERENGLKAGRQRQRQLIQLGRRYEQEHGLAAPKKARRRRKGDAWKEFLTALARVVKPAYRPAVEQLVAALQPPKVAA